MPTLPHQDTINAARNARAQRRINALHEYAITEGFLPDIAAIAAGFPHRSAAMQAARRAGRTDLAAALRKPTTAERRAARVEDLEFLLDHGEWPPRAVQRCGFGTIESAFDVLTRWGYNHVAHRLTPNDEQDVA